INDETIFSENGNYTTFETYRLRAKAATEKITLEQFARVLLMINKKRGYKSSRKAKSQDEGQLIDGMEIAKKLYNDNLTPGQLCLQLLQSGKKYLPDFYRSDLQAEFDRIWNKQKEYYSEIFTDKLKDNLRGKNEKATWAICKEPFNLVGIARTTKGEELKKENFVWRVKALSEKIDLENLAVVLQKVNGQLNASSGYLGAISDRSKELYFNKQTVGQYQMEVLDENPNASLRNMVFYRQDYLDEFNTIWNKQAEFHTELTNELKAEIRDVIIFYQRRLKSQKGLISFCEFESRQIELEIDGRKKIKTVGCRVIPRSSPLFQEFKIWQVLNNLEVSGQGKKSKKKFKKDDPTLFVNQEDKFQIYGRRELSQEEKEILAYELSIKEKLTKAEILKLLFENPQELDLNFPLVQGNLTTANLFKAYQKIIELSGHELDLRKSADNILKDANDIFDALGWNKDILKFNSNADKLDNEPMYKLWHLLYSFEGDSSNTGNANLIAKISELYGFEKEYASILAAITFQEDYGSLSSKAIRKILPYLHEGNTYDVAVALAGYGKHSKSSLTKEEIENKVLVDKLDILPKNSLRNPVVEKILNQMINVINSIIDTYGKPDEIRVELARELKKNAKEREELTKAISKTTGEHEEYRKILSQPPFNLTYISRNDIIRYKLYQELKDNGYKTLYSNQYISPAQLFSGDVDIEHIIPQSRLFDDSFSNKTIEFRAVNLKKGNLTAADFVKQEYGESGNEKSLDNYLQKLDDLLQKGIISKTKYRHLTWKEPDIPEGFINRDLGNTQYIAKYARTMLETLCKRVTATTGSITDSLREDWQLVDVMKELNWEKYKMLGLTEEFTKTDYNGNIVRIQRIKDWTKRNDHRHHAMDALTVAFTKDALIQYFNNLNASLKPNSNEYALKQLYIENGKVKSPMPLNEFRAEAKHHLENTLISIKAKNKVVTTNINITKKTGGTNKKAQLTPRGQLHLETVYGSHQKPIVKTDKKTGIKTVTFETIYTIRKEISPDLKIDKVVDNKIQEILKNRLEEFGGDAKKAFSNLDENPIWLNKEKGISIKRVTITGISNGEPLHTKKDKDGKDIFDSEGKKIPVDFVNTGNNHHVAVYRVPVVDKNTGMQKLDSNGETMFELQENVVSFYEAVTRRNLGLPVIDKEYKVSEGWQFLFSMKQNEYFVFPKTEKREKVNEETGEITEEEVMVFNPKDIDLLNPDNYGVISPNLFRVQTMSKVMYGNNIIRDYKFRHHLETSVKDIKELKDITYKQYKTMSFTNDIVKIRVNHIGEIVGIGEY
ncbi:MAG: type II CRISPR RNA-guided endonuclease Cas9, partial [Sphingobacteriia bacterium]|nr:type II CRISPR RNA-guided endonuclease Cas9 [Sphingobacteriia bacterium]